MTHHEAESEGVEGAVGGIVQILSPGPELDEPQEPSEAGVHVPKEPDDGGLEDGAGAPHIDVAVLSCQIISKLHQARRMRICS